MIIIIRDFDNNELFSAEILEYAIQPANVFNVLVPPGTHTLPETVTDTDLVVVRVTTDSINYQGYARIIETIPYHDGTLLRVRFDGYYDVQ